MSGNVDEIVGFTAGGFLALQFTIAMIRAFDDGTSWILAIFALILMIVGGVAITRHTQHTCWLVQLLRWYRNWGLVTSAESHQIYPTGIRQIARAVIG